MKILTCNIRCLGAKDGDNNWIHRKDLCTRVIKSRTPDIICFQEMWAEQFTDLASEFPEYQTFGMADTAQSRRPMNCIFYRAQNYTLISTGGYWLSTQPHVPGSWSWDSACIRLANWIRLEDKATGVEFRMINTHLDHIGQTAREQQAHIIVEDSNAYPNEYPQILTGDMNCDTSNPAIDNFKAGDWVDTHGQIHDTEDPGHTYHKFIGPAFESKIGKMDWIFMKGDLTCSDAEVIMDSENERFPSDHYFVSATVALNGDDGAR